MLGSAQEGAEVRVGGHEWRGVQSGPRELRGRRGRGPRTADGGAGGHEAARLPVPGELLSLRKDFHLIWFLLK